MAVPIEMPKLGNTVEECLLARWNRREGDCVSAGDIVAEIETDKATFEVAAPAAGIVLCTFFKEGELVPVFSNICVIGESGEDIEQFRPCTAPKCAPVPAAACREPAAPGTQVFAAPREAFLSPRARRFAEERGFHPQAPAGSGPGGRVLESDLRNLYRASPKKSSLAAKRIEEGFEVRGEGSGIAGMVLAADLAAPPLRISGVREKIARRMRESLAVTAQYTLHASADAAGLLALRARIKGAGGTLPDININEMVIFCAVRALVEMPELNAEFVDGKIYRQPDINMGFACDTDRGLLVPVVKNCQALSLPELALQVKTLTKQAVEGTIGPDDLTGATFTVSNLGSLGIESFTPILNPPQVALLGVNTIELKPVRREGRVEFVDRIGLSLTCDHQVIDGAPGARFLRVLAEQIAQIESLAGL